MQLVMLGADIDPFAYDSISATNEINRDAAAKTANQTQPVYTMGTFAKEAVNTVGGLASSIINYKTAQQNAVVAKYTAAGMEAAAGTTQKSSGINTGAMLGIAAAAVGAIVLLPMLAKKR